MNLVSFNPYNTYNSYLATRPAFGYKFKHNQVGPAYGSDTNLTVPAVNVANLEHSYRVDVAAPGYKKENFSVSLVDNLLKISAQVLNATESKAEGDNAPKEKYTRREFNYGQFERSFTLPETADGEGIVATYADGVLSVHIPKKVAPENKQRSIEIR
jgi:HSP20 family protein